MPPEEKPEKSEENDAGTKPVTIRLTLADIEAWRRITARRYPHDNQRLSQVIRDLIREEDARTRTDRTTP